MKTTILGLGSGRCGTKSLAHLLNSQDDSFVTHEYIDPDTGNKLISHKGTSANISFSGEGYEKCIKNIKKRKEQFRGDVGFYNLWAIDKFKAAFPDLKILVIQRDREETARSYNRWISGKNHWQKGKGRRHKQWDRCFPNFSTDLPKLEAIGKYWDMYYERVEKLDYADWVRTEDLNDPDRMKKALNALGFKNPVIEKHHKNQS